MNKIDSAAARLRKELVERGIKLTCVGTGGNKIWVYLEKGKLVLTHFEGYEVEVKKMGRIRSC